MRAGKEGGTSTRRTKARKPAYSNATWTERFGGTNDRSLSAQHKPGPARKPQDVTGNERSAGTYSMGMRSRSGFALAMRVTSASGLVLALAVMACEDAVDCCVDGNSVGHVRGVVLDAEGSAEEGVSLRAVDLEPKEGGWIAPGPWGEALSDGSGRFEMPLVLPLVGPGEYRLRLILTRGNVVDTTGPLSVRAFRNGPPPDTATIDVLFRQ